MAAGGLTKGSNHDAGTATAHTLARVPRCALTTSLPDHRKLVRRSRFSDTSSHACSHFSHIFGTLPGLGSSVRARRRGDGAIELRLSKTVSKQSEGRRLAYGQRSKVGGAVRGGGPSASALLGLQQTVKLRECEGPALLVQTVNCSGYGAAVADCGVDELHDEREA
jgi:hypothetical protein